MGTAGVGASPARQAARAGTLCGIGYETWFVPGVNNWTSPEAKPVLGYYNSNNPDVITQHAKWITDAGIDFILIDWSNNLGGNWTNGVASKIIASTMKLLDVYSTLARHPRFAILLGLDNGQVSTANFDAQMKLIEDQILAVPSYAAMWQSFSGNPLLSIYRGPSFDPPPSYVNPRFTVRPMSAFHETTLNPWGDWSWLDRKPLVNGPMSPVAPFSSSGLSGWQADPNWSLSPGDTFSHGSFATTQPGGGKSAGTLTSPAFEITESVLTFNVAGVDLYASARTDWSLGTKIPNRNVFLLLDAQTRQVLRHSEPPGVITGGDNGVIPTGIMTGSQFRMRQWDVSDLQGRSVVFAAVNNAALGSTFGWMAVNGLALTHPEQLIVAVGNEGNEAPGWTGDWDAERRMSGATLVRYMETAFEYEPDIVMVQQWNEFSPPDQCSVEESNDIEPTVITRLEGRHSDGWGTYYLDLVKELISQYRQGFAVPSVRLDTRYP